MWHRPRLYFTIVALYVIIVGIGSLAYPRYLQYSSGSSGGGSNDWSLLYYAPASLFLIISVLAGLLLMKKRPLIYLGTIPLLIATIALAIYLAGEWVNLPSFIEKSKEVPNDLQQSYVMMGATAILLLITIGMDILWYLGWRQRNALSQNHSTE